MNDTEQRPTLSEPVTHQIGGLSVRSLIPGAQTGGAFALLEHVLAPGALGSPPHTHSHEDEYSYVLEGTLTVEVGGQLRSAGPGELVFKPRGVPHVFLNTGDVPLRFLELITPAAFEGYFARLAPLVPVNAAPDVPGLLALAASYGLTMHMEHLPSLAQRHGLNLPGL